MDYLIAAWTTTGATVEWFVSALGATASAVYLSANSDSPFFGHETLSLRGVTFAYVAAMVVVLGWGICSGAHRAMQTVLAPTHIRHSGIVTALFPGNAKTGAVDGFTRVAAAVFYMLFYSLAGIVTAALVPLLLLMFALNAAYIVVGWLARRATLDPEPLPQSEMPIVGTAFYLLNLFFSSILGKRGAKAHGAEM